MVLQSTSPRRCIAVVASRATLSVCSAGGKGGGAGDWLDEGTVLTGGTADYAGRIVEGDAFCGTGTAKVAGGGGTPGASGGGAGGLALPEERREGGGGIERRERC